MGNVLLLIVEGSRLMHSSYRLMLFPPILPENQPQPHEITVVLRRPDGTERKAMASFRLPVGLPSPDNSEVHEVVGYLCTLHNAEPSEVPPGTEVWLERAAHPCGGS